jgi:hypothetical protein
VICELSVRTLLVYWRVECGERSRTTDRKNADRGTEQVSRPDTHSSKEAPFLPLDVICELSVRGAFGILARRMW